MSYISGISLAIASGIVMVWIHFIIKGKKFALRDKLELSDAIVVFAGTRGDIRFLQEKITTAAGLFEDRWVSKIIVTGRFSAKVGEAIKLIPRVELEKAVSDGRIQEKDLEQAVLSWDEGLGAGYMADQLMALGVPKEAIILENDSLHTKESVEYTCRILKKNGFHKIILVTSPFHQLRTFLTFKKAAGESISIKNYYATSSEWHPFFWFISRRNRGLVSGEKERIVLYRKKGDL